MAPVSPAVHVAAVTITFDFGQARAVADVVIAGVPQQISSAGRRLTSTHFPAVPRPERLAAARAEAEQLIGVLLTIGADPAPLRRQAVQAARAFITQAAPAAPAAGSHRRVKVGQRRAG